MKTIVQLKLFLFIILSLFISVPAYAVDLMPFQVGTWSEFDKHDSATPQNNWTVYGETLGIITIGTQNYFNVGVWNYKPGDYREIPFRSTENAAYIHNGVSEELTWQIAPVGTTWSNIQTDGQRIREIISIETVTVPLGTFNNAYVHRNYSDPDDPTQPNSPYWYEYVVPGMGMVKEVDYYTDNNPPTVSELARVGVVPEPIIHDTNSDWSIGDFELLNAIDDWASGALGDFALLDLIDFWAAGCYHWDSDSQRHKQGCEATYQSIDYFPLETGNTWVSNSGTVNISGETHTFTGGTGIRFNNIGGFCMDYDVFIADSQNGIVMYGVYEDGAYQDFNDSFIILPKSLKVNDSWNIIGSGFEAQLTFVGLDTVTVPAGTFADTLKIRIDVEDVEDLEGSYGTYTTYFWYAKNVGLVKAERTEESPIGHDGCWSVTSENPVDELQWAEVNGVSYGK